MKPLVQPAKNRRGGMLTYLSILIVLAAVAGGAYWYFKIRPAKSVTTGELITDVVRRGAFDHIVLEQGEIESSKNIELECEVESRGGGGTAILWVIDEGARVKAGDKLVELDSSQLEQDLKTQRIVLLGAEANVTNAAALLKQAEISRQEYLEGTFKTEEKAILSELAVAEQELRKAQLALASTQRLVAKGLVKSLQMEADQFAVANTKNQLEAAQGRLKVLQELTKQKFLVQYDSDIESARAVLEANKSTLSEEQDKYAEMEDQIKACVIYAPSDGVVVHANRFSSRGGNAEFVVEAGATVRERQAIIRLPDPTQMQVKAKINESRIALVSEGMPCKISVSSLNGVELLGQVTKVNRYAEPSSFFTSSIKEYACSIAIIDPPESIRTGMTAEVQIFVQQKPDALQIPIQGVYEHSQQTFALVRSPEGKFETRKIEVDATNDKLAAIASGLEEGDEIVLNLRQHLHLLDDLPSGSTDTNTGLAGLIEGKTGVSVTNGAPPSTPQPVDGPSPARASAPPGREGPRGPGGPGGPGAGGPPSPAAIVKRIFDESDTDKDGSLSEAEIAKMEDRRQSMAKAADADSDGKVTRAELTSAMAARFAESNNGAGR
ncbi:macrolide transporter subunit MacA [Rosistilla oblonga]|uniref:Macrolide transporter subunit MacA n=1 Tax=Rosistilla oblonga TaxID=2527990 RepID=A0A518IW92_9BACT|nr:HlyD family efflux transporter periplasmic adaptor subunit [Rosistilla oblonga]QDV14521.1 macrolide transporter subunit MacA [Rosistilla oblonga]QDV57347.1 macrolide transporter subunit MacA [Rosistilla oblonga]